MSQGRLCPNAEPLLSFLGQRKRQGGRGKPAAAGHAFSPAAARCLPEGSRRRLWRGMALGRHVHTNGVSGEAPGCIYGEVLCARRGFPVWGESLSREWP
jgi:hypothetical protein